jgi:hypothetical protein
MIAKLLKITCLVAAGLCSALAASLAYTQTPLLYDREFPVIGYATKSAEDAIAKLQQRMDRGEVELQFNQGRGYLDSVLRTLELYSSTQLLVFSKTSLQVGLISSSTPRAIYFNDQVYVAWVQGSNVLEIASMDPNLGPVFYTLSQQETGRPTFARQMHQCVRCHDSYSLTGGGTPRFMMSSGYTGQQGQLVSHESHIMTTSRTPIRNRWGGWFVTGNHGEQLHLGNVLVENAADLQPENLTKTVNISSVSHLTDTEPYLTPYSDIVALLIVEHQIEVQNLITRLNYYARTALENATWDSPEAQGEIESLSNELLHSLFMVGQPALSSPVVGVSGFTGMFNDIGPKDSRGRSLRELDLTDRLFKYPFSYLVYSEAFEALPQQVKVDLFAAIGDVLLGRDKSPEFEHLTAQDKLAIIEILNETSTIRVDPDR